MDQQVAEWDLSRKKLYGKPSGRPDNGEGLGEKKKDRPWGVQDPKDKIQSVLASKIIVNM